MRTHVHVVDAVAADGPSVVAEVVLDGGVPDLETEQKPLLLRLDGDQRRRFVPRQTFSSSKSSVKWRISANCLARACFRSRGVLERGKVLRE